MYKVQSKSNYFFELFNYIPTIPTSNPTGNYNNKDLHFDQGPHYLFK